MSEEDLDRISALLYDTKDDDYAEDPVIYEVIEEESNSNALVYDEAIDFDDVYDRDDGTGSLFRR